MIEDLKRIATRVGRHLPYVTNNRIKVELEYGETKIPKKFLSEIMNSDNPRDTLYDYIQWITESYAFEIGYPTLMQNIKENIDAQYILEFEKHYSDILEALQFEFEFYMDPDDFDQEIQLNILIDSGNSNYDFSCENVLTGLVPQKQGSIDIHSSILWLAKTQSMEAVLIDACKERFKDNNFCTSIQFVDSCLDELENLACVRSTMTFLVRISLFELLDLIELQMANKEAMIVINKNTHCGLFNPWAGSGSDFGIVLEKDLKIPLDMAIFCVEGCHMFGYDITEVYDFISSYWSQKVKIER